MSLLQLTWLLALGTPLPSNGTNSTMAPVALGQLEDHPCMSAAPELLSLEHPADRSVLLQDST